MNRLEAIKTELLAQYHFGAPVNLKLILKAVKIREKQIITMLVDPMADVEDVPDYFKIKQLSTVLSDFDQHFSSLSDAISDVTAGSYDSATLNREAKVWRRSLDSYRRSVEKRSAEYAISSLNASEPRQALSFLNSLVEPLAQDTTDSATAANHWQSLALD